MSDLSSMAREHAQVLESAGKPTSAAFLAELADEIERLSDLHHAKTVAAMKWTTKLPDRPGHWWHRYAYGDEENRQHEVWKIREFAGHLAWGN